MQLVNEIYAPMFVRQGVRYIILMGGRSAGRSHVASQRAVAKLRDTANYYRCAIMRFVLGDIRNSIFQDILDRIEEQGLDQSVTIKEHALTFEFGGNKINGIGFRKSSGDQKSKLKSLASYNEVIIEEADEVADEDFIQLDDSLRTQKANNTIVLLLNPPSKNHWIIRRFFNLVPSGVDGFYRAELKEECKHNTLFIHSTYRDNLANMSESTVSNFENYKTTKPDHYWNMIEGLVSEGARGRIFKNWQPTTAQVFEDLPFPVFYGLDFGFVNDPTALVAVKKHNDKVWTRQLIYETGLTNIMLSKRMEQLGVSKSAPIYADSEEAKSIEELKKEIKINNELVGGWNMIPADKGPGSVKAGIDYMLERQVFYTEDSREVATETQEYKWALDKDKNPTNEPEDKHNHAMDAIRYALWTDSRQGFIGFAS